MNPNQRKSTETQKEFKERRRRENVKSNARPYRVLWDSQSYGTYVRAKHGELPT